MPMSSKFLTESTGEKIVKIGQYLAKIWTKYDSLLFFGPSCILHTLNLVLQNSPKHAISRSQNTKFSVDGAPQKIFFRRFVPSPQPCTRVDSTESASFLFGSMH